MKEKDRKLSYRFVDKEYPEYWLANCFLMAICLFQYSTFIKMGSALLHLLPSG